MRIRVASLLWRICNRATFDTLHGNSKGQYDIRLTRDPRVGDFFAGLDPEEPTEHGGFSLTVPIAPFDGNDPVPETTIGVRFMGAESARQDWYIRAQRPETAYPLWRPARGVPDSPDAAAIDYVLLIRDVNDAFHARWLSGESVKSLPANVRDAILAETTGVMFL